MLNIIEKYNEETAEDKMATSTGTFSSSGDDKESVEKYPKEIAGTLKAFQNSLQDVDKVLAPLLDASLPDIHNQVRLRFKLINGL